MGRSVEPIGIVVVCLVLAVVLWFGKCQWDECREMGFSKFYCIKHIG